MMFGHNKRKLNKEVFHLDIEPIEIIQEYKMPWINFYSHRYFEPSSKRRRIAGLKALMGILRKEDVVLVTSWEHKSHLFKALMLPTFKYGTEIWEGDLKNYC